jgi:hypothetical protein
MAGIDTIGPEELSTLPFLKQASFKAATMPFSGEQLAACTGTHILVLAPAIPGFTLVHMRDIFGTDPAREPCMYAQDWYLNEDFANAALDGQWHLIRKDVLEEARAKTPEDIESKLQGETFPTAATAAFAFFAWYLIRGEVLWKHDFIWCSDRDHNGDRVYVGRYVDPDGVNKNGFNIHRHLSLRSAYSAAPEAKQGS